VERRPRILLVEDDRRLATLVRDYLGRQGFEVAVEDRGDTAADRIRRERPDLVILDLMLPGRDGLEVCREVRPTHDGPILILTAREDDIDEVAGLEIGADDYVKKPVEPRVLLARVRALLRRVDGSNRSPEIARDRALAFGSLRIATTSRTVELEGQPVELTTNEFDLLRLLASRAGEVVSRDWLFRELRGIEYDGVDRSVDIAISRLRKKLEADPSHPRRIRTVWRRGYLFVPDAW
jgi:DNA-binding response OmpR family regulator